jgi:alcohol dehydrogenase
MKAVFFDQYRGPLAITDVPDPLPAPDGVVVRVHATGVCRSDWHAWQGHDPDVQLPHVPGHELAGTVEAVGASVQRWKIGDRVTVPFVCGCGHCAPCVSGDPQVCLHQFQPGFTGWGSFAERVALRHADGNLVRLPDALEFVEAASLGCRFVTAFRAVVALGQVRPGEWVVIHGCGGVGLAATMIAVAAGAQVIAVDVRRAALDAARDLGAAHLIEVTPAADPLVQIRDITRGGAHLSLDALGHPETCRRSILGLRPRGRHVQVGLLLGDHANPPVPMAVVIARELQLFGSHGMAAHAYPPLLDLIVAGRLKPGRLVRRQVRLEEVPETLQRMGSFLDPGISVVKLV